MLTLSFLVAEYISFFNFFPNIQLQYKDKLEPFYFFFTNFNININNDDDHQFTYTFDLVPHYNKK